MSKKRHTREAYLAAKNLGGAEMVNTSSGPVLLNLMKHYCLQKPYKNSEFNEFMLADIKRRYDRYQKENNKTAAAVATAN